MAGATRPFAFVEDMRPQARANRSLTTPGAGWGMVVRTRFRRIVSHLAFHAIVLGLTGFFAWNAYTGDRGLMARKEHKIRIAQLSRQLDELQLERTAYERRVQALGLASLDKDLLDERARTVLNLAQRTDVVIQLPR